MLSKQRDWGADWPFVGQKRLEKSYITFMIITSNSLQHKLSFTGQGDYGEGGRGSFFVWTLQSVSTLVSSVNIRKEQNSHRVGWYTNMATISLFWNTDMVAVMSCAFPLYFNQPVNKDGFLAFVSHYRLASWKLLVRSHFCFHRVASDQSGKAEPASNGSLLSGHSSRLVPLRAQHCQGCH